VDGSTAVHVYRVVQEALNNVTRHAAAKQAWVRLRSQPQMLEVEIEDHGKGFSTGQNRQGIGLVAMRERAEILGGNITFTRPTEGGTLVRLIVPKGNKETHAG
jgi:signal transduction histidine kinase